LRPRSTILGFPWLVSDVSWWRGGERLLDVFPIEMTPVTELGQKILIFKDKGLFCLAHNRVEVVEWGKMVKSIEEGGL